MGGRAILCKEGTAWGGPAALPRRAAPENNILAPCLSGARLVDLHVRYLWGGG